MGSSSAGVDTPIVMPMSTAFYPRAEHPSDFVVVSADGVLFSLHKSVILARSSNRFGSYLADLDTQAASGTQILLLTFDIISHAFSVEEPSDILNIVFHCFYEWDPTDYLPTLDQFSGAMTSLSKYGLAPQLVFLKGSIIYNLVLEIGFEQPLETYAVVCHHNIEVLAVDISRSLIGVHLSNLNDELCIKMGPVYLRRLVFLHLGRTERLKILLSELPVNHPPLDHCNEIDQQNGMELLWRNAANSLCWEANANTSVADFQLVLNPVFDRVFCFECKAAIQERIRKLTFDWTMVKSTI